MFINNLFTERQQSRGMVLTIWLLQERGTLLFHRQESKYCKQVYLCSVLNYKIFFLAIHDLALLLLQLLFWFFFLRLVFDNKKTNHWHRVLKKIKYHNRQHSINIFKHIQSNLVKSIPYIAQILFHSFEKSL